MEPIDAYRAGYLKGQKDGLAENVGGAIFGQLREDPGGYYAAGHYDGARGRKFQLPAPSAPPVPLPQVSLSETERAWFQLCRTSEFLPHSIVAAYWERFKKSTEGSAVYLVGLLPFYELTCPHCRAAGYFKGHILGSVRHPSCGNSWYVRPLSYIGKQLSATFHSGLKAGGSIKEDANRKGDQIGGWLQGFLVFYFVAAFRLLFALILIPLQAVVSLAQSKPNAASGDVKSS